MQMNESELRAGVIEVLRTIAPEVQADELLPGRSLREQVDLDSMDWLNVIVALHERLNVEIPESDYARLTTLDAVVAYIGARRPA